MAEYPCGICQTEVADDDSSILSCLYDKWHHTIYVNVTNANYEKLKVDPNPWLCPTCAEEIPFLALANKDIKNLISNGFPKKSILKKVDQKTKIHLEKFKELNQVLNETENNISCDYFEMDEFKKIKIKQHDFLLLHLNISSLSSHTNELVTFLNLLETKFDIRCITESRLSQKNPLTSNISIPGYNIEHTPTEACAGEALMIISQTRKYKVQKDLQIYCSRKLESVLIKLLFPNKPSFIIGTIYEHPTMQNYKFNIDFMENLLNKTKPESKRTILAGDFNLNLIKYPQKTRVNKFL